MSPVFCRPRIDPASDLSWMEGVGLLDSKKQNILYYFRDITNGKIYQELEPYCSCCWEETEPTQEEMELWIERKLESNG